MTDGGRLRLRNVDKWFGRSSPVLSGVELDLDPAQIVGVVGPNGSGKSTLLRIIAGVSEPSRGTVTDRGLVGYLPDRFPAAQRMSAVAYLTHMGRIRKLSRSDAKRVATQWLERLELVGGHTVPLRELSKGNAQKVGLAQACLGEPELLVLDEPWSGLDRDSHGVLGEIIAQAQGRGASVVFTHHRAEEALAHTDDVLRISEGSLAPVRAPERGPSRTRIVLRGPGSGAFHDEQGVLAVAEDADRVVLTVSADRTDELLTLALRRSWSVYAVVPLTGASPR